MAIHILPYIEPLSKASESSPSVIIQSEAYRRLVADLARYIRGQIDGRSFLVAGHRGAGKTTMVRKAVEEVGDRIDPTIKARPLLVPLHGPSLLAPPTPEPAPPLTPTPSKDKAAEDTSNPKVAAAKFAKVGDAKTSEKPTTNAEMPTTTEQKSTAETPATNDPKFRFLERVVSGLWAAAADEFARAMREYAAKDAERLELAAQFRVELDLPPELDRLRSIWSALAAMKSGILFSSNGADRGAGEMMALYRLGRAIRPIYGKIEASQLTTATATRDSNVSLVTIDGQNLLQPLLGLASGALVWNSLSATTQPLLTAFTSILTGLSTVLALKWSETRTQNRSQTWSDRFIPNNDAQSLYRVLPELIQTLRDIGLHPVFVVDELDKVPELGLDQKLDDLLGYLKQFVTERAFFCFLTDRAFYEWNEQRVTEGSYSIAHTRFGDRLFVQYDANDIHEFLDELIPESADQTADEKTARILIRYIVMHRSYMHPYDLRRRVGQWTRDEVLALEALDVINRPSLNRDVIVEVAVELMLRKASLKEYLQDPAQAQVALDALYYPSRCWHALKQDFDVSELKTYLIQRTGIRNGVPPNANSEMKNGDVIREDLFRELSDRVDELMEWFVDPALLIKEAQAAQLSPEVIQVLSAAKPLAAKV